MSASDFSLLDIMDRFPTEGSASRLYNAERRHQGLGRRTPDAVYADSGSWPKAA